MSDLYQKYEVLGRLAQGGVGEIVLARQVGLMDGQKFVVIKRLRARTSDKSHAIRGFLSEARILAGVSHPNVCQVLELGNDDGRYYLVMEYLDGLAVNRVLKWSEKTELALDVRAVAAIVTQACHGLHHVHRLTDSAGIALEIVHRDVSPHNLFITTGGVVKVVDFGIASTRTNPLLHSKAGKAAYMAPEQIHGTAVDLRADVYALGVVMRECLTRTPQSLEQLGPVITRATSGEPIDRYPSCADMAEDIAQATEPLGGPMSTSELAEWLSSNIGPALQEWQARVQHAIEGWDAVSTAGRRVSQSIRHTLASIHPPTHSNPPEPVRPSPLVPIVIIALAAALAATVTYLLVGS